MSEEVRLDGVNVMCKDIWTNETWFDHFTVAVELSPEFDFNFCSYTESSACHLLCLDC